MQSFHKLATTVIVLILFACTNVVTSTHPEVPYTASNTIGSSNQVVADGKNIIPAFVNGGNDPVVHGFTANFGTQDSHGHQFSRRSTQDSSDDSPPFRVR